MTDVVILQARQLPADPQWLSEQPWPVIVVADDELHDSTDLENADVVVSDLAQAEKLAARVQQFPRTALVLVQVLRASEALSVTEALHLESLAYATLQAGAEFQRWREDFVVPPPGAAADPGEAIIVTREANTVHAVLNRPASRNAISLEMRDALVDVLTLVAMDADISRLQLSANGACFSVGGELREFGTAPDAATAHWVRTVHSPARLMAKVAAKTRCRLHGACIGSGIELPAFAAYLQAHKKTFFQLPELQLGLIPGAGGTVSIARRIGRQRMVGWLLSGRRLNADTALAWGLVDELFE